MIKKDFIEKISTMQSPEIEEFDCSLGDLPETCWLVFDEKNPRNKFCTPVVKMSQKEYRSGKLELFDLREKLYREKYERWIKR